MPHGPTLGKAHFAECPPMHSAIFFYFGPKFFSMALWQYFKLYLKIWGNFNFLIYFISLFRFVEFFEIFQIWTAGTWNNGLWSSKNWYSWYLGYVWAVSRNSHEILMWRCLGFWHPTSQLARNLLNFFTIA